MRANVGISIACLSALSLTLSVSTTLRAQAPDSAAQTPAPATASQAPVTSKAPAAKTPATPPPAPAEPLAPVSVDNTTQDSANDLSVAVGKSVLVDFTGPIKRAAIGQPDIADITATSASELMVNGKITGQTSLIVWEKSGGRQFFNVTVRPNTFGATDKLDSVRRELALQLPDEGIKVSAENGNVFLRGQVRNLADSDRAVQIAGMATAKEGKVVNLLYVDAPKADQQILLKVRFASIDRSKAEQMGINLFDLGAGNAVGGITTGQFSSPLLGATTSTAGTSGSAGAGQVSGSGSTALLTNELNLLAYFPGLNAGADIEALETTGVAEVLSEPNVVAVNGKQASFLAGGEYPFPVAQGGSGGTTITIQWKEYGVRLNFIPTILPSGMIRLQVSPEVSALDFANSVEIAGASVPALTVRRVRTEAELSDGQSFVIGGLLDNRETETFSKVPFIGDIPILGKLFQSMSRTRSNTELIVIVTPEIVNPIPAGSTLPELKFPRKFLPTNTGIPLNEPDGRAGSEAPSAQPEAIPVETLIDNQKQPEPALSDTSQGPGK